MWRSTRCMREAGLCLRSAGTRVVIARRSASTWRRRGRRVLAPVSCLEPYRAYIEARFEEDPHLEATVLHRELVGAGLGRAYTTLVGELRRLELRPVCLVCAHRRGDAVTTEIDHPAGEEIQWDWLELAAEDVPWGEAAYVLVGALSHSGRFRGVFCEQMTFGHLAAAMHQVLVALGGSARVWRTDRMATVVSPQTGRITPDAAALAKHYGVADRGLPRPPGAAQGRRRGRDQVPDQELVADGGGRDAGRGAALPGPLERRRRRRSRQARRDRRAARRRRAAAGTACGGLPGADRR